MAYNPSTYWAALADNELTIDIINETLAPIQDDLWVAAACGDRFVDSVEVQQSLLDLGIARTRSAVERCKDALAFSSSPTNPSEKDIGTRSIPGDAKRTGVTDETNNTLVAHFRGVPDDAQLCNMRAILLERLDRLNTYVDMCKETPPAHVEEIEDEIDEWEDDPWAESGTTGSPTITKEPRVPIRFPIPLPTFLTESLLSASCCLASLQWFGALQVLLKRHGSFLWPYRFFILEAVPEHVHPSEFREALPTLDTATGFEQSPFLDNWRAERDWSEASEVRNALAVLSSESNLAHDSAETQASHKTISANELSAWYRTRGDNIIKATGFIDIALSTIQHGTSQGIPGLDELEEELSLLSRLVYDTHQGPDIADDWTLDRWRTMEPFAVIQAYLAHSTPESLPGDITRLVMPYLFVLESRAERAGNPDPDLSSNLLYEYILSTSLEMVAAIFEASKPTLPPAHRLIRNDEDIARLALACLYGNDSLDQWPTMSRIFECLPAWDVSKWEGDDEDTADTTMKALGSFVTPSTTRPQYSASELLVFFKPLPLVSLSRALDILDVHLESGEILSRWGVPAPLRWFLQSNSSASEQSAWANRMARRAGGFNDQIKTQEDWEWLLDDMLKLSGMGDSVLKGAFGLLSSDDIMCTFFSGMLSSGNFDVARTLLHSPKSKLCLNSIQIEDICLSCSREFYDNAPSGNYKFGDMKLAYECLDVPGPNERLLQEKEFIEATSRISSFNVVSRPGIPISPIEIRLTKDRLSLVSRVLSSNSDAYKHTEVILDLVHKLGFRDDPIAEVKTLAMLADTALQAEDFIRAHELSEQMVEKVVNLRSTIVDISDPQIVEASEVCWVACFQLGRQQEFDDLDKKLSLLGRALELCPPEKLHDVLIAWRRLEKEDIETREERVYHHDSRAAISGTHKRGAPPINVASSLRARLQHFHMPSPPLLSTPDAAALASRTFRSVAANFPFSVGQTRSHTSDRDERDSHSGSQRRLDGEDVSAQATRVFSKGIGWLIGADDGMS